MIAWSRQWECYNSPRRRISLLVFPFLPSPRFSSSGSARLKPLDFFSLICHSFIHFLLLSQVIQQISDLFLQQTLQTANRLDYPPVYKTHTLKSQYHSRTRSNHDRIRQYEGKRCREIPSRTRVVQSQIDQRDHNNSRDQRCDNCMLISQCIQDRDD